MRVREILKEADLNRRILSGLTRRHLSCIRKDLSSEINDKAETPPIVFIWIPKNAGTSLYNALNKHLSMTMLESIDKAAEFFQNRGSVTFGHMDYSELVKKGVVSRSFDDSSFKFAFSRNPYDRAVSLYTYLKKTTPQNTTSLELKKILSTDSFIDFSRMICSSEIRKIGLYNRRGLSMCNPQVRWIENIKNLDYLGKFESFQEDARIIFSCLGLPNISLPHLNSSKKLNYRNYYCDESFHLIQAKYKEDFIRFGYNRDVL